MLEGIHRSGNDTRDGCLSRRAGDDRCKHDHGYADPADYRIDGRVIMRNGRVKSQAERQRGEDQIDQSQVQNEARVSRASARVREESEGRDHTHSGDDVGELDSEPVRVGYEGVQGQVSEDRRQNPEGGGKKRHDSQPTRRFPEQVWRKFRCAFARSGRRGRRGWLRGSD